MSALDIRTCPACLALHGRFYELHQPLVDHPNGRCFLVPVIKDLPPPETGTGEEWFNSLSEDEQRAILGPAKFDAYQKAQIDFGKLAILAKDPTWGGTLSVATLKQLGLK